MKIIATDFDGTLLNHNSEISAANAAAIRRAQSAGVTIVAATGRLYPDARDIWRAADLKMPCIAANGAFIYNEEGNRIADYPLAAAAAQQALTYLNEQQAYHELSGEAVIYTPNHALAWLCAEIEQLRERIAAHGRSTDTAAILERLCANPLRRVLTEPLTQLATANPCYKIFASSYHADKLAALLDALRAMPGIAAYQVGWFCLDIVAAGASKGAALDELAKRMGLQLRDCAAIGDSDNDLSMLKNARIGIAMKNADDDVKRHCEYTTEANDDDGVARAIDKLLNGEWR